MTQDEFNKKYSKYIELGFYGLEFDIPEVTEYLYKSFDNLINGSKEFEISQIKLKFGYCRFYSSLSREENKAFEDSINFILNNTKN